jgi:predicted RNA-binding Zn ribbon-like protein
MMEAEIPRPTPMTTPPNASPSVDFVFDLDGGRACLDFANTLSSSSGDHLTSYADLIAFAAQSHLVTPGDADWLHAEAAREPVAAEDVVLRARRLRSAIYAIFSAVAGRESAPDRDLDELNANFAASMAHARVVADNDQSYRWDWSGRELDSPLWPIARSAADLLTSTDELPRVRECTADNCQWLFLDTTRNRSRQWCSMGSCGNRQKARRHYQRIRELQRSASPAAASVDGEGGGAAPRGRGRAGRTRAARAGDASARAE